MPLKFEHNQLNESRYLHQQDQNKALGSHLNNNFDKTKTNESLSIERDECTKKFKILSVLGEGTYGVVYQAIDTTTEQVRKNIT
jgi:serine/threonine protein kinase